jgi:parallel beta-helix repeat protein
MNPDSKKTLGDAGHVLPIPIGLAVILLWVGPAQAQSTPVTTCGQVLSAPGQYHLTGNLGPCTGNGVVITASDVDFTLAGFTLSGVSSGTPGTPTCNSASPQTGVLVEPAGGSGPLSGVRITGGTVTGFVDGVVIQSSSDSRVAAMTVTGNCIFGISVGNSQRVRLETNVVTASGLDGVGIGASHDVLVTSNDISGNTRVGVDISNFSDNNTVSLNILKDNGITTGGSGVAVFNGNNNTLLGNAANGNFNGILLSTLVNGTVIRDNVANGNLSTGIVISTTATSNAVKDNTARGNGTVDLSDGNSGCDTNTWKKNTFGTDSVAGISDGGPGTGCIR